MQCLDIENYSHLENKCCSWWVCKISKLELLIEFWIVRIQIKINIALKFFFQLLHPAIKNFTKNLIEEER